METPSQDLKNEHEAIQEALDVLEKMCANLNNNQNVSQNDITDMIDFLKVFADKCHHGKEENHFFPALEEAGIARTGGPIGVMLDEHEQGRELIKNMHSATAKGDIDKKAFVEAASSYIDLLRNHINKENTILFPMGDARLTDPKQNDLLNDFETLETEVIGEGKHEELHRVLESLKEKYLQ
ncbi:MAG: hemerythrin domain-containing protein [Bacteroidales bacterium]|nr:hemerythrin domain-containing protein [Bacteroidales bacterium]MCF8336746.1 hemerythrin domain-containing protein [Bacteroidales bacterium]